MTEGLLLAVKENIAVEGQPYECGSATRAGVVATETAPAVAAALAAGFVFASMADCDEFAYGCTGELNARGPVINPIARGRVAGGSSSGCAAAVASGAADVAIGTDTAGSVRIPAALCGVYGFKPSYDSISRDGVFPLSTSLDHVGMLGRDLPLVRRLADALLGGSGPDARELVVARPRTLEAQVADEHVGSVWRRIVAALELRSAGALPGWDEAQHEGAIVQAYEAWAVHRTTVETHAEAINPDVLSRLRAASAVTADEYRHALDAMTRCRESAGELLGDADVVALPTVPVIPPQRARLTVALAGLRVPVRRALLRNTRFANYCGLPALSLPVWLDDRELPVGLQLVGRSNADVLAAGAQTVARLAVNGLRTSMSPTSASPGLPAARVSRPGI